MVFELNICQMGRNFRLRIYKCLRNSMKDNCEIYKNFMSVFFLQKFFLTVLSFLSVSELKNLLQMNEKSFRSENLHISSN